MGIHRIDFIGEDKKSVTEKGDAFSGFGTDTKVIKGKFDASLSDIYTNQIRIMGLIEGLPIYKSQPGAYNEGKEREEGEDMNNVNWQEKYLDNLDNNMKEINENLSNTEARISEMINKQINHSTHLDKQRHEENIELNKKIDQSMSDINAKLDSTNNWIIGLVITTIIGVAGIALSVIL